jgi:hypothetical protein
VRASLRWKYYKLFASNRPGVFYFNELRQSQVNLDAHVASSISKELRHWEANILKAIE